MFITAVSRMSAKSDAFRFVDPLTKGVLPMGSHWLWHVLGAVTTAILAEYFYRIEQESKDEGRTWADAFYLMRTSTVDGQEYELRFKRNR